MTTRFFLPGIALVGAMLLTQTVYAQVGGAAPAGENAVSLDIMPIFKGIIASDKDVHSLYFNILTPAYERSIVPHFSVGAEMDLWFGRFAKKRPFTYFAMIAHGRWYPLADFSKFFVDAGLGFNLLRSSKVGANEFTGLIAGLKVGWKHHFNPSFYVEPSIAYNYSKGLAGNVAPVGWEPGLIAGLSF
ncbi:MAG: hypothetical protein LBS06_00390 [Treponema sp.]|jgi:hypothetical protein|nr:hypothetical protein [Treponema sp.]